MASPQLENGFTRIANEILENIAKVKLSPTQYRIIFVVWRCTYGFQKKTHELSLTFISNATGCDTRHIQRELKKLIELNILTANQGLSKTRNIGFNKNFKQWKINNNSIGETDIDNTTIGRIDNGETDNTTIGRIDNGIIGRIDNQKRNKDIYKEIYSDFVKILIPLYPGKKIKATRDKKLPEILKKYNKEEIIRCVKRYADEVRDKDQRYILNESTFWNGRYMDYLDENYTDDAKPDELDDIFNLNN